MHTRHHLIARACSLALALAGSAAMAQEVTLKAVNAFQEGTYFARGFEKFVKKVNDEGKGIVQINYIGGPKAIPTFEQPNALRNGVVDMANTTSSFTAGLVPDGLAFNYTHLTQAELRKNGIFDQINASYADKGLHYYARTGEGIQYYLYTTRKVEKADLTGFKLRVAPIYRDFLQKQNATVVQMAPGEVYTALERGVVDGYAWPMVGIFDLGWHEKTKFRVEPGFYAIELGVVFNQAAWNKLTPPQKAFMEKQAVWLEAQNVEMGTPLFSVRFSLVFPTTSSMNSPNPVPVSRRRFLKTASLAALAAGLMPRGFAAETNAGPARFKNLVSGRKLRIASVGIGGKGYSDTMACLDEDIVALCDVDFVNGLRAFSELPLAARYRDYRQMLTEMGDRIDAVSISTPDHMHFPVALMAIEMGKHVYVQK